MYSLQQQGRLFTRCVIDCCCEQAAEGGKPGSEGGPPGKKRRGSGGDADQEAPSAPEEEEKPVEVQIESHGSSEAICLIHTIHTASSDPHTCA